MQVVMTVSGHNIIHKVRKRIVDNCTHSFTNCGVFISKLSGDKFFDITGAKMVNGIPYYSILPDGSRLCKKCFRKELENLYVKSKSVNRRSHRYPKW